MTTAEMQNRRAQVEQAIVELLNGFMRESGLVVTGVDLETYVGRDDLGRESSVAKVQLKAELPPP